MSVILETTQTKIPPYFSFDFEPFETEEIGELLTVADLEKLPKSEWFRYELIDGEILTSEFTHFKHQIIVSKVLGEIGIYLKKEKSGEVISALEIGFDNFNQVIPDLIYVSHEKFAEIYNEKDGKFHGVPELIIEILSAGKANFRRDKILKFQTYERFGVEEYWIVNPFKSIVEIYRREGEELNPAQICTENDEISTPLLPNFSFAVNTLFAN